ncbi:MAG: inositol monophosphatase family protein [Bacteroidetes bacterium]|nr:inositol monophosphatase family protein [Bacteroidota bacterium]
MNHKLYKSAIETITLTGQWIAEERRQWDATDLKIKADTSLVTSIDLGSELRLKEGFLRLIPTSEFIAEETSNIRPNTEWVWIIDPIDGTTNFVHGLPMYCISVALYHNNKPVFGCIYEISSAECFTANADEEGAYLNGKRVYVSKAEKLKDTLLATGFPTVDFTTLERYINILKTLMLQTRGIRRLGSAAMDLAYVACGRCDGFYEFGLNPWDVAAGAYLVQKAGGKITDFSGEDDYIFGRQIIGSNGLFHQEFLEVINNL